MQILRTSTTQSFLGQLPYLVPALKLVWRSARGWTAAWAVLLLVQGLLPVVSVYLTRALVDGLVDVVETGGNWAMDSWAEAEWLARYHTLAAGRTSVIITHRFTTAMQADMNHVMVKGQVVESGSHDQLMAMGGRYATSWTQQMQQSRFPAQLPRNGTTEP